MFEMAVDPKDIAELEARKRASLGQVLIKAARLLNEQAMARVRELTWQDVRPTHTTLFPHIDLEGTRITEIAQRMGLSKQAVGQLVTELESMDVLERVPDPTDGRAKLVRFARRDGRLILLDGLAVLAEFEDGLVKDLGRARIDALRENLGALLDVLESRDR
ncbi:MAG: MarR family transcriptional regulator [Nannocystaceae bacterium]|nr:MarR family transcriptional regulator [Nannocystaceae bacterium]